MSKNARWWASLLPMLILYLLLILSAVVWMIFKSIGQLFKVVADWAEDQNTRLAEWTEKGEA